MRKNRLKSMFLKIQEYQSNQHAHARHQHARHDGQSETLATCQFYPIPSMSELTIIYLNTTTL